MNSLNESSDAKVVDVGSLDLASAGEISDLVVEAEAFKDPSTAPLKGKKCPRKSF